MAMSREQPRCRHTARNHMQSSRNRVPLVHGITARRAYHRQAAQGSAITVAASNDVIWPGPSYSGLTRRRRTRRLMSLSLRRIVSVSCAEKPPASGVWTAGGRRVDEIYVEGQEHRPPGRALGNAFGKLVGPQCEDVVRRQHLVAELDRLADIRRRRASRAFRSGSNGRCR